MPTFSSFPLPPFLGTYLLAWSEEGKKGLNNGRFVGREGKGEDAVYAKVGGNEKRGCIPGENHVAVVTVHVKKKEEKAKGEMNYRLRPQRSTYFFRCDFSWLSEKKTMNIY